MPGVILVYLFRKRLGGGMIDAIKRWAYAPAGFEKFSRGNEVAAIRVAAPAAGVGIEHELKNIKSFRAFDLASEIVHQDAATAPIESDSCLRRRHGVALEPVSISLYQTHEASRDFPQ